jgi:MFS family permease
MSTELPEPGAHPGILDEPSTSSAPVRSRTSGRRLGIGFFVVGFAWVFANSVASALPLQAKIAILAPDDKVVVLAVFTAIGGVFTTLSLFFWGSISDLTRSKAGKRTPWIAFGAVTGTVGLVLIEASNSVGSLLAAFIGYGLVFNALPAAVLAVFPDRVPRDKRGTASAVYGGAQVLGGAVSNIIASQFLSAPSIMFYVAAAVLLVGGLAFVAIAPDYSSADEPRVKLDMRGLADSFRFPANAPDFYWAFAGRFLLLLGLYMVQNFTLYILTDYIGLTNDEAAPVVAISGAASLVTIVLGISLAGPISDRIQRRRMPIFIASMLFGVAVVLPLVWPTATSMIIFGAVAGLGLGAFLAVDTALMTEVLPNEESRGKDLGILNTANTVPGVIAPLATAGIIAVGLGYPVVFCTSLVVIVVGASSIFKIRSVR